MNYGFRWIESEAHAHECEVVYVKLDRRNDCGEVALASVGVRGEMFGVVLIAGDRFRAAIVKSTRECEAMVRYETQLVAACTRATARLDPTVELFTVGRPIDDSHVVAVDYTSWTYRTESGLTAPLPPQVACFNHDTYQMEVRTR